MKTTFSEEKESIRMADRVGQQLGNYRLVRLLGRGGFAEVYLGEHVFLGTQAAIKVLQMQVAASDTDRFLAEARTIAHLQHPHIVRVLEFGMEQETPYLVMEYAPYGSLRQRHPKGTILPMQTIITYVNQVASALQYAHDQKLIHRDIKPENMLIGSDHQVKLSDFGIALIAQSTRYQTQDVIGTVAYMAPEQLQGKPRPASDQYSLGIVVYEWLSGTLPFQGSFTEVASQHVLAPPPPLHDKVPGISPVVEQAVMIALAKDPQQRFASVRAFAHALEQAWQLELQTEEVIPPPPPPPLSPPPPSGAIAMTPTPSSGGQVRVEEVPEAIQASISTPPAGQPIEPTVLASSTSSSSRATPRLIEMPPQGQGRSNRRLLIGILSGVLAVLVIGVSILIYYTTVYVPHQIQVQATEVAQTATSLTATAQAQATATASSPQGIYMLATSGTPALDDSLSSQSGGQWDETSLANGHGCQFSGGAYHALASQQNTFSPCYAEARSFGNFAFQVQMTIIKGDGGGLVFRAGDSTSCQEYVFFVNQDGSYNFSVYSDCASGQTLYSNSIYSSSIFNQGLNQSNLITVIARQNTFYFYVNRQYIVNYTDSTYTSGKIGVLAHDNTQPTEVVYTNAEVWQL
jgi:serine/threonine protein kinase